MYVNVMSESSPYNLLSELAARARQAAIELPPEADAQTHWTGLGFNLLGQRFVAPMDEVSELMRVPATSRIPGVKNFVLGIGNVRGKLMAVLDLALFFGESSHLPRSQRRVLSIEDEELYLGFAIDDSLGMQHFPSDTFNSEVPEVPEVFTSFTRGSFQVAGITWPIMSLKALADDPRLERLAGIH